MQLKRNCRLSFPILLEFKDFFKIKSIINDLSSWYIYFKRSFFDGTVSWPLIIDNLQHHKFVAEKIHFLKNPQYFRSVMSRKYVSLNGAMPKILFPPNDHFLLAWFDSMHKNPKRQRDCSEKCQSTNAISKLVRVASDVGLLGNCWTALWNILCASLIFKRQIFKKTVLTVKPLWYCIKLQRWIHRSAHLSANTVAFLEWQDYVPLLSEQPESALQAAFVEMKGTKDTSKESI